MTDKSPDWLGIQERLLAGDRLALLELNRLITSVLARMRAYDFRDEWDDLRQEVAMAVVANARAGRLRDPQAFVGYVRIITRNKFVDRLKRSRRTRERDTIPWDDETARAIAAPDPGPEDAPEVWAAVRALPEEQRVLVEGVYLEGRTYQEVSDATGVPLGTLKRRLRDALAGLRARFSGSDGEDEDG